MEKNVLKSASHKINLCLLILMLLMCIVMIWHVIVNDWQTSKNVVDKATYEVLYNYSDEHDDSLICGLSTINKVKRQYSDNTSKIFLHMAILCPYPDVKMENARGLYLDSEEISNLEAFVDSCLTGSLVGISRWELHLESSAYFEYNQSLNEIFYGFSPGYCLGLQITPQRLKEVLTRVMEDENLRDDE